MVTNDPALTEGTSTSQDSPGQPRLAFWCFAAVFVVGVLGYPLWFAGAEHGRLAAEALLLASDHRGGQGAPLAIVPARLAQMVPLGGLAPRAGLVAALGLALAMAAGVRWLHGAVAAVRPRAHARVFVRDRAHEPIAVVGALAIVGLSALLARADAGATLALLIVVAALAAAARLLPPHHGARDGAHDALWFFFLAGLSAGVASFASALLWPLAAALWLWGLRQGARWPLLAPFAWACGGLAAIGAALLATADPAGGVDAVALVFDRFTLGGLRHALGTANAGSLQVVALSLFDELGVVALLLAVVGAVTLAWRAPALAGLLAFALWGGFLLAAAAPPRPAEMAMLAGLLGLPIAVGIAHLSDRLGRARVAAAAALAVMAAVVPAIGGAEQRFGGSAPVSDDAFVRALADLPARAAIDTRAGGPPAILRWARAQGLRPDLRLGPAVQAAAPNPVVPPRAAVAPVSRRKPPRVPAEQETIRNRAARK